MVPCGSSIDLFCGELTVLEGTHVGAQAVYNCYTTGETRTQVAYCRQSGAWWFPVQDCRKYMTFVTLGELTNVFIKLVSNNIIKISLRHAIF